MLKNVALVGLGFVLYPAVFVPVMMVAAPTALEKWVYLYADYLRLLGF